MLTPVRHDTCVAALLLQLGDMHVGEPAMPWQEGTRIVNMISEVHVDVGHVIVKRRVRRHVGDVSARVSWLEQFAVGPFSKAL